MWKILSIIADAITVLGIGGIVSWSIFGRSRSAFEGAVLSVLIFSAKIAVCLAAFLPLACMMSFTHVFAVIIIRDTLGMEVESGPNDFWSSQTPVPFIISLVSHSILILPFYLLFCFWMLRKPLNSFRRLVGIAEQEPLNGQEDA